jgi:hypothetical protein
MPITVGPENLFVYGAPAGNWKPEGFGGCGPRKPLPERRKSWDNGDAFFGHCPATATATAAVPCCLDSRKLAELPVNGTELGRDWACSQRKDGMR